jgi:predicted dehydrogenase
MEQGRRSFLKIAGAALAAGPVFVPHRAWGANSRPAYGVIGVGGRGRWLSRTFQELGAQCVALCDVYAPNLDQARTESPADAKGYVDYQELLEQPGIDFVVIATPDHQHRPNLLAALEAGKDVYLEKPLSLNIEESDEMVRAVRKTKQIVQIGIQRRSMPFIWRAKSLIDEGMLGKISMVKAKWNWNFNLPLDNSPLPAALDWERFLGPAPKRPLEPMRFRWWRGFWDYSGGNMTDQGTHLMDVVQWLTGSRPPLTALCAGKTIDVPGAEVPNVFSATFEYPEFLATWTLDYRTSFEYDWSIQFIGDRGAMVLDRHGSRIYSDPGASGTPWAAKSLPEVIYQEADRDSASLHMKNLLEAIRERKEPNCPIEVAAAAVAGPHMANLAYREDRKVKRAVRPT